MKSALGALGSKGGILMSERRGLPCGHLSADHSRVLSARIHKLEEYCARLEALLSQDPDSVRAPSPSALHSPGDLRELVKRLRADTAEMRTDLGLEAIQRHPAREAVTLAATMIIAIEELQPLELNRYGKVPEELARYLESKTDPWLEWIEEVARRLGKSAVPG
jgi:hypothetical protein